jgi:hypothetical protein
MRHDFDTALDRSLALLRSGEDIDSCLARYPEYTERLRPLLEVAAQVGRVITPAPSQAARAAGEQKVLAALARKREREAATNPVLRSIRRMARSFTLVGACSLRPAWSMAAIVLVVLVLAGGAASVAASTKAIPGDALYAVKLASQRVQLSLTFDASEHRRIEDRFQAQQRDDVQQALRGGRQAAVEFQGELEQIEGDHWTVGGLPVTLQAATVIVGQPTMGRRLRVRGKLSGDGSVLAVEIQAELNLTPEPTETPAPTDTPEPSDTPRPTATLEPTDTPAPSDTPQPTETRQPTEAPEWTSTPRPTETREPTDTPEPTETPAPTETPEPIETPAASVTPEPDRPGPTEAPEVSATPEPGEVRGLPTDAPEATETPKPTKTHEPTETPKPAETPKPTKTHGPDGDRD